MKGRTFEPHQKPRRFWRLLLFGVIWGWPIG